MKKASASVKKHMSSMPKGYEKSKFDNDKGVKEGSKADKARDMKAVPKFLAAKKKAK